MCNTQQFSHNISNNYTKKLTWWRYVLRVPSSVHPENRMEIFSSKSLTVAQYSRVNHVPDTNSINHQIFRVVACTNVTKVEMRIQNPFLEMKLELHQQKQNTKKGFSYFIIVLDPFWHQKINKRLEWPGNYLSFVIHDATDSHRCVL